MTRICGTVTGCPAYLFWLVTMIWKCSFLRYLSKNDTITINVA